MNNTPNHTGLQKIDLRKIFLKKNPKLAPIIPGFVYRYLDRALHIPEINTFIENHGNKAGYDFLSAVIEEFNVTTTINGYENLPDKGRFIFVSNHPLGGFDGMLLIKLIYDKYRNVKTIINDILMSIRNLEEFFIPINKHGGQATEAAENLNKILSSDTPVLTFPAGLVSRKIRGVIRDVEWKKNFIHKAVQFERDVIPIHVSGRCSNFFYNLANIRKLFGIKSNIEMFYLPDETFRHKNEHIEINFGSPVSWQTFNKSKKISEWAILIQDYVYSLPGGVNIPFNPDK